jgi:AAA family ATP:ADP antiporter
LKKGGGFQLVFKKKYLFAIALFVLLLNFINTNGEFILGNYIEIEAPKIVETGNSGGLNVEEYIGKFYAEFFKYVNLLTLLIQLFLVSRIFKWIGVRGAIFVLPLMALGGYSFIAGENFREWDGLFVDEHNTARIVPRHLERGKVQS